MDITEDLLGSYVGYYQSGDVYPVVRTIANKIEFYKYSGDKDYYLRLVEDDKSSEWHIWVHESIPETELISKFECLDILETISDLKKILTDHIKKITFEELLTRWTDNIDLNLHYYLWIEDNWKEVSNLSRDRNDIVISFKDHTETIVRPAEAITGYKVEAVTHIYAFQNVEGISE